MFTLHWSKVDPTQASIFTDKKHQLLAIWPAPVNPDQCFEAAGFNDFGDQDANWDKQADAILDRLILALDQFGPARLLSKAILQQRPWYARLFRTPLTLPLREQVSLPMLWDSLPRCQLNFGNQGVALNTGDGHHLYWITLPHDSVNKGTSAKAFVDLIANETPTVQTILCWEHLLPKIAYNQLPIKTNGAQ